MVIVLKSGLRISIRAPEVLFSEPPKHPKRPIFGVWGVPKMAVGVPESKF